jgi:ABC-type spermidine/putrescine transport system permease subunit II
LETPARAPWWAWAYVAAVLAFLYVPLVPPVLFSVDGGPAGPTVRWYREIWTNPILVASVRTSLLLALLTGLAAAPLGLLAAMAVRQLRAPRAVILLMLLPLFIPGVSMGLASAFLFRFLGVAPSLWTILVVNVLWALPFAFLIVLTAMATFDPVYLEAAYVLGAGRLRAFLDVELPLIGRGVAGAALFAAILALNETVRTALVQGPLNTVQTYIWATYLQVGLAPTLHALMSLLIGLTLLLVLAVLAVGGRRRRAVRAD